MDLSWASLPPASDPALAEWLEGASCSPHVKALAVRAADAAGSGVSADQWRRDLLAEHPGSVTRTFGTPGGERHARGMKTVAQATHLHDHVLAELELGNAVGDDARQTAERILAHDQGGWPT